LRRPARRNASFSDRGGPVSSRGVCDSAAAEPGAQRLELPRREEEQQVGRSLALQEPPQLRSQAMLDAAHARHRREAGGQRVEHRGRVRDPHRLMGLEQDDDAVDSTRSAVQHRRESVDGVPAARQEVLDLAAQGEPGGEGQGGGQDEQRAAGPPAPVPGETPRQHIDHRIMARRHGLALNWAYITLVDGWPRSSEPLTGPQGAVA